MRDYAKVAPQFWTGETGRKLRKCGAEAQVVAMYLITCPAANMIGLYYVPLPTVAHETGIAEASVHDAMDALSVAEFAYYDHESEVVWVPKMAEYQIGPFLKEKDKRVGCIRKEVEKYSKCEFFSRFMELYGNQYHLSTGCPFEGASKGHRRGIQFVPTGTEAGTEAEAETGRELHPDSSIPFPAEVIHSTDIFDGDMWFEAACNAYVSGKVTGAEYPQFLDCCQEECKLRGIKLMTNAAKWIIERIELHAKALQAYRDPERIPLFRNFLGKRDYRLDPPSAPSSAPGTKSNGNPPNAAQLAMDELGERPVIDQDALDEKLKGILEA